MPSWLKTLVDHNRYTFMSLLAAAGLMIWLAGCGRFLTAVSPFSHRSVNDTQLTSEANAWSISQQSKIDALLAESKAKASEAQGAFEEIQRKRDIATAALSAIGNLSPAASPWGGLLTTAVGLAGLGLAGDNARKNAVIARLNGKTTGESANR